MNRPRLQIHLSTLMFATLLAAGLMWSNIRTQTEITELNDALDDTYSCRHFIGWPWEYQGDRPLMHFSTENLAWNIVVCLIIVVIATLLIEGITRVMKSDALL